MESQDPTPTPSWLEAFTEREQKSIDHARLYVQQYDHGDPGHLYLTIIARLATLLDARDGLRVYYTVHRTLEGEGGTA
jgi:hypothetical protein